MLQSFNEEINSSIKEFVTFNKENFELCRSSKKAIPLLNDNSLNKLFYEKNNVPSVDVLFIFKIYFHLINHEICRTNLDNSEFWLFVCNYLLSEGAGKTGKFI